MTIAVLIAGEYREFEHAIKSWNFLKHGVDIYMSTWTTSDVRHHYLKIHKKEIITEEKIRKIISPVGITIMNDYDRKGKPPASKIISHWKCCITMMNNLEKNYDTVILIRPDLFLKLSETFEIFLNSKLKEDVLYSVNVDIVDKQMVGIQDQFFIGTQHTITRFSNFQRYPDVSQEKIDWHYWLNDQFRKEFNNFETIPGVDGYCITRANTTPEDIEFYQVREKTKIWWEAYDPTGQSKYYG